MKSCKKMLIIQVVLMYLVHLPFYILLILCRLNIDFGIPFDDNLFFGLLLTGLITSILLMPYIFINFIFALISLKGQKNPSKTTMIIKLSLIPWYILNILVSIVLLSGFLNPWLFLAAPIAMALLMTYTYILMASTSMYDLSFFINKAVKKEIKVTKLNVFNQILLFIFCLDIIASIIFYKKTKELE